MTHTHTRPSKRKDFYQSLLSYDSQTAQSILDQVEWTNDASSMMETLLNTQFAATCVHRSVSTIIKLVHYVSADSRNVLCDHYTNTT